ncbi:MAG: hypothetical protein H8E21_02280 [Gammaproteobacteria bacterium]|nr:hypothetical protein [Gammaproteobacteria bacterium]MBL7000471.1 hypothetical protein [Gammaproteobacteria bacterium]
MTRLTIGIILYLVLNQSVAAANAVLWTPMLQSQRDAQGSAGKGQLYRVDSVELRQRLSRAAPEGRPAFNSTIEIPLEQGVIQRFSLEQSPIMAPELAARYPEITSYRVHGIDDPHASGRISLSPAGFHGMISSPAGTVFIDPQGEDVYRTYRKSSSSANQPFSCGVAGHNHDSPLGELASRPALRTAGSLRVYRLALATTGEYVEAIGAANKTAVVIEINKALNRVNEIYERVLGIQLQLVANNDLLIYTNKNTDPYDDPYTDANSSPDLLLEQNQKNIRTVIGSANYDIGHVFSRGGGGLAQVGAVCADGNNVVGDFKAGGVTGHNNPTGDNFYIDYVAHEIGHQFNAEHSFNGTTGNCSGNNRVQQTAYEPGSGSTIMSYAGICGSEDISDHAIAMFHAGSIAQIDNYTTVGDGASCGSLLANNNPAQPTANAGSDHTIPAQTPFILSATGSDTDFGDTLTYSWDQMDAGTATSSLTFGRDLGNNSLFRSYLPSSSNQRHFPALGTTLKNQYDYSEVLPCRTRSINFRLTVLDGKSGIASDNLRITVDADSGPFKITSHTVAQTMIPGVQVLTWNVASTSLAPVNCSNVDISLLTFNAAKTSYTETLLADNEANDGRAFVSLPIQSSAKARFKVQCSNNIFYDISDADLIISSLGPNYSTDANSVANNLDGIGNSIFSSPAEVCSGDVVEPVTSSGGGGSLNLYWLLSLLGGWMLGTGIARGRISGITAG